MSKGKEIGRHWNAGSGFRQAWPVGPPGPGTRRKSAESRPARLRRASGGAVRAEGSPGAGVLHRPGRGPAACVKSAWLASRCGASPIFQAAGSVNVAVNAKAGRESGPFLRPIASRAVLPRGGQPGGRVVAGVVRRVGTSKWEKHRSGIETAALRGVPSGRWLDEPPSPRVRSSPTSGCHRSKKGDRTGSSLCGEVVSCLDNAS